MQRKDFLKGVTTSAFLLSAGVTPRFKYDYQKRLVDTVLTVTGRIPVDKMEITLVHEHILSIFGTAPQEPAEYDESKAVEEVVPYLRYIKSLGCNTVVDCSAAYLGRNVALLKKISEQAEFWILISTGIYGAADDRYVPEYAYKESAEQLAQRWIWEFKEGIQGTDVKPGFVKSGVDPGPLSTIDARLVRAAAITHLETGLLLQIHTSDNPEAADQQLAILKEEGVSPEAWVWVHAQNVDSPDPLLKAAGRGAWISLDGLRMPNYLNGHKNGDSTVEHHYNLLTSFKNEGLLDRVLLSHDGSTFPPAGTPKRPMDILMNTFIPMLRTGGFSEADINQVTITNPARAFNVGIRKI